MRENIETKAMEQKARFKSGWLIGLELRQGIPSQRLVSPLCDNASKQRSYLDRSGHQQKHSVVGQR